MTKNPLPKPPGAQPGNHNALSHGFYSRFFTDLEHQDLDALPLADLSGEIALLRISIRRIMNHFNSLDDLKQAVSLLKLLTKAVSRLARLYRIQSLLLNASKDEAYQDFRKLLEDFAQPVEGDVKT